MSLFQNELIILLIGPSGSGKSSFVQALTSDPVPVSHLKPCTSFCTEYRVKPTIHGRPKAFLLIDTPGFVETPKENIIVLEKIAKTLTDLAPRKVFGAIYFHNIAENRMKGTTIEVLDIFKAMCGREFYPHIVFVTTMWDSINPKYHKELRIRNDELERGPMKLKDAPGIFKRLRDDDECAKEVLNHFWCLAFERPRPPTLLLMSELRGGARTAANTAAGRRILQDKREQATPFCCTVM